MITSLALSVEMVTSHQGHTLGKQSKSVNSLVVACRQTQSNKKVSNSGRSAILPCLQVQSLCRESLSPL